MDTTNWWQVFLKDSATINKLDNLSLSLIDKLKSTIRLFSILKKQKEGLLSVPRKDLESWFKKAESLHADIKQQEKQTKNSNSKIFYATFAQSIEAGLRETKQALSNNGSASTHLKPGQTTKPPEE